MDRIMSKYSISLYLQYLFTFYRLRVGACYMRVILQMTSSHTLVLKVYSMHAIMGLTRCQWWIIMTSQRSAAPEHFLAL